MVMRRVASLWYSVIAAAQGLDAVSTKAVYAGCGGLISDRLRSSNASATVTISSPTIVASNLDSTAQHDLNSARPNRSLEFP